MLYHLIDDTFVSYMIDCWKNSSYKWCMVLFYA